MNDSELKEAMLKIMMSNFRPCRDTRLEILSRICDEIICLINTHYWPPEPILDEECDCRFCRPDLWFKDDRNFWVRNHCNNAATMEDRGIQSLGDEVV